MLLSELRSIRARLRVMGKTQAPKAKNVADEDFFLFEGEKCQDPVRPAAAAAMLLLLFLLLLVLLLLLLLPIGVPVPRRQQQPCNSHNHHHTNDDDNNNNNLKIKHTQAAPLRRMRRCWQSTLKRAIEICARHDDCAGIVQDDGGYARAHVLMFLRSCSSFVPPGGWHRHFGSHIAAASPARAIVFITPQVGD